MILFSHLFDALMVILVVVNDIILIEENLYHSAHFGFDGGIIGKLFLYCLLPHYFGLNCRFLFGCFEKLMYIITCFFF